MWNYFNKENLKEYKWARPRHEMIFRRVKCLISRNSQVLEIGFGTGELLKLLIAYFKCSAIDIAIENVGKIREKLPSVDLKLVNQDGTFPYEDNSFSSCIASEVLEHMSDKELNVAVFEIYRILKKNGYAIITLPAEEDLDKSKCFCPNCENVFHRFGHKQSWNKDKIKKIFKGFENVDISEYYNRFVGESMFENFMGIIMWLMQSCLNFFIKFPNKIYRNRSFVIVLKK